jgi:hypothetical protein
MVGRLALLAVARAVCICATLLPLVPAVAAAVAFRPPVLVARASPDCTNCPRPNWITPACDGFISLGRGVIVSPWNQGLSFALSLDNGKSWRNRTQLQPDPGALRVGSAWPAVPVLASAAGVMTNLGLLPGACNATGHDKAVATACPGLKCSATASPAFATFRVNSSAPGGVSVGSSCGQVEFRGYPHPLLPQFGLLDGFTFPTDPVRLADGSLLVSFALKTADESAHHDATHHLPDHYPMNLVIFRSTDGRIWDFLSTAVNHTQLPWSYFGERQHLFWHCFAHENPHHFGDLPRQALDKCKEQRHKKARFRRAQRARHLAALG